MYSSGAGPEDFVCLDDDDSMGEGKQEDKSRPMWDGG
jgi:hypothetical protein